MENEKQMKDMRSKRLDIILVVLIILLVGLNLYLTIILNRLELKHDSISYYVPDFREKKIKNYNLKKDIKDLKEEIEKLDKTEVNTKD